MHRKIYYKHHNKLPNPRCDVHHIDGNRYNNNIDNLIEMPRQLHQALHNYIGLLPRKYILLLLKWFVRKQKNKFSKAWLELNIKKQVSKFKLSNEVVKRNREYLIKKEERYKRYISRFQWQEKERNL